MRVCIIGGCGHAEAACRAAERGVAFEFCGISRAFPGDPRADRLADRFREAGRPAPVYADAAEMLREQEPEIVVVDGIFGSHAREACMALERGMHVLSDKPAATTLPDLALLRDAIRKSGRLYWSMLTSRYDPWFVTARDLVRQGEIGEVRLIQGQKSYKLGTRPDFYRDPAQYGGTIAWVAIHMIDLALWITGRKCRTVSAFGSTEANGGYGALESAVVCGMELEDGILASIQADYLRLPQAPTHGDDRIRIVGTRGTVEVRRERVLLTNAAHPEGAEVPLADGGLLFADFLEAAAGRTDLRIDTESSLYGTLAALKLTQSLKEGRTVRM